MRRESDIAKADALPRDFLDKYYGGSVNFRGMMGLRSASVVIDALRRYQAAGVTDLCIWLVGKNQVKQLEPFMREVLPAVAAWG